MITREHIWKLFVRIKYLQACLIWYSHKYRITVLINIGLCSFYECVRCPWKAAELIKTLNCYLIYYIKFGLPWWLSGEESASLIQEDPACHGVTKPASHSYQACALEAWSCSNWNSDPRALSPQEKPQPWEAHVPQLESSCRSQHLEKKPAQQRRPSTVKNKYIKFMYILYMYISHRILGQWC